MTEFLVRFFIRDPDQPQNRAVRMAYGNLACWVGIVCNVLLFAGKFAAGLLFGSLSVAADGLNNLSDASSNIVSLVGFRLGAKPADEEHPYGHARYEYIAAMIVSVIILLIGFELLKESVLKLITPAPVAFSALTAAVLLASIGVKLWLSMFNRTIGTRIRSEALLAAAADARNDVISTAAVLAASVLTQATGIARIDGLAGAGVAVFILLSGAGLLRDTLSPLLGAAPDPELIAYIKHKALSYPGVLGIHDLMIHDYGPGSQLVSFHLELPASGDILESHDLVDSIERDFLLHDHLHVTIHMDPIVTDDPHINELRDFLREAADRLEPQAEMHDLRIVPGPTHTNVIFECAVPAEWITGRDRRAAHLAAALRKAVAARWPDHFCVIQFEPIYAKLS